MAVWEKNLLVDEFEPIWSNHKKNIKIGRTRFTDYKVNDTVILKEYDENKRTVTKYTGRRIRVRVLSVVNYSVEFNVVGFSISGLEQFNVFQYVDSETYKKYKEGNNG